MKRIFFGVNIPYTDKIKEVYEPTRMSLQKERIKWVDPENLHITLLFLGNTEESFIPTIIDEIEKDQHKWQTFFLQFNRLGIFKNFHKPRVIWLGIDPEPSLENLKFDIDRRIKNLGIPVKETHTFRPHLTIGRIKYLKDRKNLKDIIEAHRNSSLDEIKVDCFYLYESILTRNGPIYKVIRKFNLD